MSIVVSNLSYQYRSRSEPALVNVSVQFGAGELTLIAGASGCGKTTLVRCINGLIPNSYTNGQLEGVITLFGQNNASMPLAKISQMVGTVLQDPERQIVASEVVNEIAFGLENLGLPREEILSRIHEVARFLHIEPLLERETFRLSGGEKQKVALAGVLAMRPRALLLDEPLASLDPASGYEALTLMRQLADSGIAVVIIEHRAEDVLAVHPDHCVYMTDGRVTFDGDAAGLMQVVNWREIKLPAGVVIARVRSERDKSNGQSTVPLGSPAESPIGKQVPISFKEPESLQQEQRKQAQGALIEFTHVRFSYGDGPEILHDVSFKIHSGDRIGLLGPNGAGKTTLVKHAIGLNKPTRGQVQLEGRDSRTLSVAQIARTVGYVFQSPSHMLFAPTVREELSFGPRNIGLDADATAVNTAQALSAVNLSAYIDTPPLSMSFGQQKRISIASVMTMNPRVLVMDEPTAGQDYANYTRFMDDIVGHNGRSFETVLFITHDVDLAITYANRIMLIADGNLVADGTPADTLKDYGLLERCRIRPTSLLDANLARYPQTGRYLPAAALAQYES